MIPDEELEVGVPWGSEEQRKQEQKMFQELAKWLEMDIDDSNPLSTVHEIARRVNRLEEITYNLEMMLYD